MKRLVIGVISFFIFSNVYALDAEVIGKLDEILEKVKKVESLEQRILELEKIKQSSFDLPKGAVIAVNSSESVTCPGDDWKLFKPAKGRFIIGAGHSDTDGLTPRKPFETGGKERHALTVKEMPKHSHGGTLQSSGYSFEHHQSNGRLPGQKHGYDRDTAFTGEGKAHNNMPPFIALYFCEKVK